MRTIACLLFSSVLIGTALGQPSHRGESHMTEEQQVRLEKLRVAYFTENLELTVEEARAFWPVLQAHEQVMDQHRAAMKALMNAPVLNERDAQSQITQAGDLRKQAVDMDSQLLLDLLPILGAERTLQFPATEREFRKSILESSRARQGGPPGGPKRPQR